MCGRAAPDHHGYLARVKMELFTSAYCVAGCTECEVTNIYPPLKLMVFVDDITSTLDGANKEVAEMGKKGDEEVTRRS